MCLQCCMCTRLQLHDSTRLFQGCGVVEPAVLSIDCYFEASRRRHRCLSPRKRETRESLQKSLPFSGEGWRGGGAEGRRVEGSAGNTCHASPTVYDYSFRGSDSAVAITHTHTHVQQKKSSKESNSRRLILGCIDIMTHQTLYMWRQDAAFHCGFLHAGTLTCWKRCKMFRAVNK